MAHEASPPSTRSGTVYGLSPEGVMAAKQLGESLGLEGAELGKFVLEQQAMVRREDERQARLAREEARDEARLTREAVVTGCLEHV